MHTCRICNKQNIPENSIQIYCKECRDRIEKDKASQKEYVKQEQNRKIKSDDQFENLKKIFNFK